jgi:threonine dehydrogenase-like Zn-dependent dehydrogenase
MAEARTIRSLGIEAPGKPYFFTYEEGPPAHGHVRLNTLYSGFSAGTELTFLKGTNPYLHARWDNDRGIFLAGEPSTSYPFPFLGYMEVASVAEAGSGFAAGEIVSGSFAHKSGHTADPFHDLLVRLPEAIDPVLGVFVAQMGPIAANGVLHADAETFGTSIRNLGEGVAGRQILVVGGGTVGLLTALFAHRAGAEVIVAEPSAYRRQKAEQLGFVALTEEQGWQHAKAVWHHGPERGADLVFQTRAHSASLHAALRALRPQGTIVDLAFYQGGAADTRLGEEFHHNGLNIRCAQIGRVPRGLLPYWDRRRLAAETIGLLQDRGADILDAMISHIVPIDDAPAFLEHLLADRPEFLQIVFRFSR